MKFKIKIDICCLFGGLAISVLLTSCVLDHDVPAHAYTDDFECVNLPPPPDFFQMWNEISPIYYVKEIAINPNNPLEMLEVRTYPQVDDSMFYYNLGTGRCVFLRAGDVGDIEWGADWILFSGNDGLQRMKPDGGELTTLPTMGVAGRIRQNPTGDKFFFANYDSGINYLVADMAGNVMDTLKGISPFHWYAEDSILGFSRPHGGLGEVYLYEISTGTKTYLVDIPVDPDPRYNGVVDLKMFPDPDRFAIMTNAGLWVGSHGTKNLSRIATGCDSRRFVSMHIANDGLSLITHEVGCVLVDSQTVRKTVYVREIGRKWTIVADDF